MNARMLKSKIVLHGDTISSLANVLNIARATLSNKINESHGAEFTQNEIATIASRYELTSEEIKAIFFSNMVS